MERPASAGLFVFGWIASPIRHKMSSLPLRYGSVLEWDRFRWNISSVVARFSNLGLVARSDGKADSTLPDRAVRFAASQAATQ
jgi:hypothetical protein